MGTAGRFLSAVLLSCGLFGCSAGFAAEQTPPVKPPEALATTDERARRLDALFAELQAGHDGSHLIEQQILEIWHTSGDPEVDRLMAMTLGAMNAQAYEQALTYLDRMVVMRPDFAEGWNKRATVYYLIDDYGKSMEDIERTLVLEPRHFGALAGIGMIMVKLGDKRRAVEAFRKALEVNPNLDNLRDAVVGLEAEISRDL